MLDEPELGAYIDSHFTRILFRLETLPRYTVASDGDDYQRFLAGEPAPTPERKEPWLAHLRSERARGLYSHRVRLLRTPLTEYLRFCCEWGYALNVPAGEDVRVVDTSDPEHTAEMVDVLVNAGDYWLIDGRLLVLMRYGPDGRFVGAEPADDPRQIDSYRRVTDLAWPAGTPFLEWCAAHPQEHRRPVA